MRIDVHMHSKFSKRPSQWILKKIGLVVPADGTETLCDARRSLADDPPRLKCLGSAARRYAEERSFKAAFLRTWELYNDAMQEVQPEQPSAALTNF